MLVKRSLAKLSLASCVALMVTHAFAQSAAQPRGAPELSKTQTAAANAKTAKPLVATATIGAAGSVIVLADGIVANAILAQIQPPADGFVYER
jgi:CelD/BcsL family acetyltransferase involved in cellulose biosynthesis